MPNLTRHMQRALDIAKRNGAVIAGQQIEGGRIVGTMPATVLRALETRGLVNLSTSPDGNVMAKLAPAHGCTWYVDDAETVECNVAAVAVGGGGAAPRFRLCEKHLHEAIEADFELDFTRIVEGR